ncbi:hypothetical protein ROLI_010750 [Roseobacter fucihabitans]|uniref:DUF4145 domain-containing protein n=1 Tax=Roseobacter fucihabitans TaxID=1537242 RepID=A0ABZ2BQJ9_9RHOB|nr:hypothetical protein [Roseobacter litoralis]MBC6965535.1 hypothetical protein [Roseobacter litoralis]
MTMIITAALDKDALLAKSQLYVRKSLLRKSEGDLEEYQLWASLALELLGKSALANIHPSLIADPLHYQSLFAASGIKASTDIKTITAKTLFERLGHLVKPFDQKVKEFCNQVANRRNAELHSGDAPFAATRADLWEAEYWYAVDTILKFMDETLEGWLGADDAATPQEILSNALDAKRQSVEMRIEKTREAFESKKRGDREKALKIAEQATIDSYPALFLDFYDASWECECPSCAGKAYVIGEMVEEEVIDTSPEEYVVWETVERWYRGDKFKCPTCELKIDGYDELEFAELLTEHSDTDEREMEYEPDYGND